MCHDFEWRFCAASVQPERRRRGADAEQPNMACAVRALPLTACQRRAQTRPVKRKANRAIKRGTRNFGTVGRFLSYTDDFHCLTLPKGSRRGTSMHITL